MVGEEVLTEEEMREIKQGLKNIREGKVFLIEDVAKELGVELQKNA